MAKNDQGKQDNSSVHKDSRIQIIVALIGATAVVVAALISIYPPPPPPPQVDHVLITDFSRDSNPLPLTSGSLCQTQFQDGRLIISHDSDFAGTQNCTMIAGNRQYEELGYLEALFNISQISPNAPESSAFIQIQTDIAGIVLEVRCGIQYETDVLRPYLSIATVGQPDRLTCPPGSMDDPSDGRCSFDIRYFPNMELTADQDYILRLTANSEKPNVFECQYDDGSQIRQDEYYADLSHLLNPNSLAGTSFSRFISVNYADASAMTISVDDIYEGTP